MTHEASTLTHCAIHARDGEIGSVVDLLFDDDNWTVRWLVVDTGNWLPGRQVLLPSSHLDAIDADQRRIAVALTREQVKASPGVETHLPVSRQAEAAIYGHYGWDPYWFGPVGLTGAGMGYPAAPPYVAPDIAHPAEGPDGGRPDADESPSVEDTHLRSVNEVTGYAIAAQDGDIGHVEDFLIDENNGARPWSIHHIVVDTKNWWPGKFVLITPDEVQDIRWNDRAMQVRRSREEIKQAPEYTPQSSRSALGL
ncbi:PRC-barrel domain-containing protein [Chelatococcus sp. GCM10030263]|uniref:PRC-barrel domain-containing protein n=1 Tax=Chelatococcus sp. GCM10030263 TaxID=3273387 RepID=UPI003605E3DC